MQNFIFISPNFPTNYWQFCRELKNNGLNAVSYTHLTLPTILAV